jgi:Rrf2 family protein
MARGQFALAVQALVLLANASEGATSSVLASRVDANATCLRRVLAPLARAGLVVAAEGRAGGYRLARPAAEITLADVYAATSGEPLLRLEPTPINPCCPISMALVPALAQITADAEARFQEALARWTLNDVADQIDLLARWIH